MPAKFFLTYTCLVYLDRKNEGKKGKGGRFKIFLVRLLYTRNKLLFLLKHFYMPQPSTAFIITMAVFEIRTFYVLI